MKERKQSRKKMVSSLKAELAKLPERDRKSFLRGWVQVDRKIRKRTGA